MKFLSILLLVFVISITGCVRTDINQITEQNTETDIESNLIELAKNYYRYEPSSFEQALNSEKVVFLNFHANWCPTCKLEDPEIKQAFNELEYEDVIGFQIHFNDDETKDFDEEAIKNFQVGYQHTKIILKKDGFVSTDTRETFTKERFIEEIEKARI